MKGIIRELEKITAEGYSYSNVFDDWIDLMINAFTSQEEDYLKIVKRYRNNREMGEREIDHFAKALSALMQEMQETNEDILGEVYMEWGSKNKSMGQFFTPTHICRMMAELVGVNGTGRKVLDPCCGSGRMLVEGCKTCNPDDRIFMGQDLDMTCVKMTALNLMFFNLNGYAIQGNTLAFECNEVYETRRTPLGGDLRKLQDDDLDDFRKFYIPELREQGTLF
jgi:type I restriction-modification system DNA methylase subunit